MISESVKNMATKDDIKNMATKDDIENLAKKTQDDLNNLAQYMKLIIDDAFMKNMGKINP